MKRMTPKERLEVIDYEINNLNQNILRLCQIGGLTTPIGRKMSDYARKKIRELTIERDKIIGHGKRR